MGVRRHATRPMTYPEALEVLELRKAGMSITDICIAMDRYHNARLSHNQVRYLVSSKAKMLRGPRPAAADKNYARRSRRAA